MSITEEMYETYSEFLDIEIAALKAVIEVETDGNGLDYDGRIIIRWEGHKFRQFLSGAEREDAERKGYAYTYADRHNHPQPRDQAGRHLLLMRAMEINPRAALMSISMGLGQVMGFHYAKLGFATPQEMFKVNETIDGQMQTMMRFIDAFGLVDELRALDWAGFARGYNGSNYKVNRYDEKLKAAYIKFGGTGASETGTIIKMGSQGDHVEALQRKLFNLGYPMVVDGEFGTKTKAAVQTFQMSSGITPDGIVGNKTFQVLSKTIPDPVCETEELEKVKKTCTAQLGTMAKKAGGVIVGAGVIGESVTLLDAAKTANEAVGYIRPIVNLFTENIYLFIIAIGIIGIMAGHRVITNLWKDKLEGK